jgi:X-X-X-Leu-X-X-Gly heptad repeat protein
MATLEQVRQVVTMELRERVDRLMSAVEDEGSDFAGIAQLATGVGALADAIGELYGDVDRMLTRALRREVDSGRDDDSQQEREQAQGGRRPEESKQNGSRAEEATKEELLERAREVNVEGRSSMSKEELARAVEAEESLTKEELLERARQAGIEGRSSMSKEELRKAVADAGS